MSAWTYDAVTERITKALGTGVVPWRKPWNAVEPMNAVSKHAYRGINYFLLALAPYRDSRWLSFRQAKELGGHVRRGEEATLVIFWKRWEVGDETQDERQRKRSVPLLRHYFVFNAEQCDGIRLPPLDAPVEVTNPQKIEAAERLIKAVPDLPAIRVAGDQAFYLPSQDRVQIPDQTRFRDLGSYYATLFHELGHATGHRMRLNRPGIVEGARFGSEVYSREELVAELTSAFCCAHLGLDNSLVENAASYINGWLKALKSDSKALVVAAANAQRAADYIRGIQTGQEAQREL